MYTHSNVHKHTAQSRAEHMPLNNNLGFCLGLIMNVFSFFSLSLTCRKSKIITVERNEKERNGKAKAKGNWKKSRNDINYRIGDHFQE